MSFFHFSLKSALAALLLAAIPALLNGQGAPMNSGVPRDEEVRRLIATLQSTSSSQHDKVVACHRLAVLGPREAVPALAALLNDEKLAHMARHALEPMTEPSAGAALRDALGKLQGDLLVGVVNSIGFRRDAEATTALTGLLGRPEASISTAAAAALGRIGTVAAATSLQGALAKASGPRQIAFADASLTCAEGLVAARKGTEAAKIFDSLSGKGFPDYIRTAAMHGAITARGDAGVPLLLEQLRGSDPAMLSAAWRAARELPGSKVTKALTTELGKFPAEKQISVIQVLGDRGDKSAHPAVLRLAQSGPDGVRLAALTALPRLDENGSSLAVLLQTATAGKTPAETEAALAGLSQIGGADTNAKILTALPTVSPPIRVKLIGVLGARRADNARGELLKLAGGADADVSKAAFRALALVARPSDLPELIRLSTACRDEAVKVPADLAVFAVSMKIEPPARRAEPVLAAYRAATDAPTKCSLLRPLGAIVKATGGSPQLLDTMKAAWRDPDAQVRATALRSLADWPDASPAALLLDVFLTDPDASHRAIALRGGTRMAGSVAAGRDSTKLDYLAWLTKANQAVRTNEEKLIIVSGLGSVKQIEGLNLLVPYLDDPGVQNEAALAVLDIAPALAGTQHATALRKVLDKITTTTKDDDIRRLAGKAAKAPQPKKKS